VKKPEQNNQRAYRAQGTGALQSRKATAPPHTGILRRSYAAILLTPLIDSLRSPYGLPRAVFLRSASILSIKPNFKHEPQNTVKSGKTSP
jgi:hypothetical protein